MPIKFLSESFTKTFKSLHLFKFLLKKLYIPLSTVFDVSASRTFMYNEFQFPRFTKNIFAILKLILNNF